MLTRITIGTTQRTGSNLLLFALAVHPLAICGGEVCGEEADAAPGHWLARSSGNWNLGKVFWCEKDKPGFLEALSSSCVVYLYREDREAQLRSWSKACATGEWLKEHVGPRCDLPENAAEQIEEAAKLFRPNASLALSYEELTADWSGSVQRVLEAAGWPVIDLPKMIEKQRSDTI